MKRLSIPREAARALDGSIEKWTRIVTGKGTDDGADNCPLCQVYLCLNDTCAGCPVRVDTGCDSCEGTPYVDTSAFNIGPDGQFSDLAMLGYLVGLKARCTVMPAVRRKKEKR